jgi:hypothetical protein
MSNVPGARHATATWTWVAGSDTANAGAVYGTLGVAGAGNIPGAREEAAIWSGNGFVWLFGGEGCTDPQYNDLWKYPTQ